MNALERLDALAVAASVFFVLGIAITAIALVRELRRGGNRRG